MRHTIEASEKPIIDIFCDKYVFNIPSYQRPYSWSTEQANELFDDLWTACGLEGDVSERSPYFLGSIVLIKNPEKPESDVVDGQQRLTTITILLCILRDLSKDQIVTAIHKYVCQAGDPIANLKDIFRVNLRERDREFFQQQVQKLNATNSSNYPPPFLI